MLIAVKYCHEIMFLVTRRYVSCDILYTLGIERSYFRQGYQTSRLPSATTNFIRPSSFSVNWTVSGSAAISLEGIKNRYAKL